MIMVQFEDSLRQRSEVQISIRSSYSEKIFYEKKKFDDLWAHYHGLHSQPSDTYWARLGKKKKNFDGFKVGPGQKFPWVKAGKNPIRHVIAYTLNMDEMMMIWNETFPFLGYSTSKSKIGIFVVLTKKSKITIFRPFDVI